MTLVSIVVNYNGATDTIRCVESLTRADHAPHLVIVVDNASTDDSLRALGAWATAHGYPTVDERAFADRALDAPVTLVASATNVGFAGGCNIGMRVVVRHHPSAWILLLNNDATIAPDAIRAMIEAAAGFDDLGAIGATVLRDDRPDVVELLGGATVNRLGMVTAIGAGTARSAPRPATVNMDYVSGCCLLTRADVVNRVGLMDERYFLYSEDVDWGLRMRHAGLRLAYSPHAEVRHKGGAAVVHRSPVHDYFMVRGALMLVQKHWPAMLPLALVHWAWRGVLPKLVRLQWTRLGAAARGYRDFVRGATGSPRVTA
jgi:GT2 family glycosyltransferase